MSQQDRYIPGVPCWVDTSQPDPVAAVAFYRDLFGWELEDVMPPGSPGPYYVARIRGGDVAGIGAQPEGGPPTAVWNTYVWVTDADETAAKVRAAGGTVLMEPGDVTAADPADVVRARRPGRHDVLDLPPEQVAVERRGGGRIGLRGVDPARDSRDVAVLLAHRCSLVG